MNQGWPACQGQRLAGSWFHTEDAERVRATRGCRGRGPPPSVTHSASGGVWWALPMATRLALHPPERVLRRGALEGGGLGAQVYLLSVGLPPRLRGWRKSLKGRHPGLLRAGEGALGPAGHGEDSAFTPE